MAEGNVRRQRLAVVPTNLLLFAPCLIGYAIRLGAAGGNDLGLDGGLSVALAMLPLHEALGFLAHDVHPPLYYLLLRPWLGVAGTSPLGIKYLGVVLGTLALAVVIGWVRSLAGIRAALAIGGVGALAPAWVIVDVTVREYTLALLLVAAMAWTASRWSPRTRGAFVILGVAAIWASYLSIVVPLLVGVDGVIRRDRGRLAAAVLVGLSLVPWLAFAFSHGFAATLRSTGPRQAPVPADPLLQQFRDLLRLLTGGPELQPSWLGPVLVAVVVVVLTGTRWRRGGAIQVRLTGADAYLFGGFVAGAILALAINTTWTRQGMGIRYTAPLIPFVLAGLGRGIAPLAERSVPWAGLVVALAALPGVLGLRAWEQRRPPSASFWDPPALVHVLDAQTRTDDAIVFVWPEQAGYYQMLSAHPRAWVILPSGIDYLQGDATARARSVLPGLAAGRRVVWLVLYHQVLGTGTALIGDWLSANAYVANGVSLPDSDVVPYAIGVSGASPSPFGATFVEGIHLVGAGWPRVIQPGTPVLVDLEWKGDGEARRNLRVFVHLVDATGRTVAQHDGAPENGRAPVPTWVPGRFVDDRHGLLVPEQLAPGAYWLEVGLYDDAGRLPLAAGGDTLRFGPLTFDPASAVRNLSAKPRRPASRQ